MKTIQQGGYAGKILRVDLTKHKIEIEDTAHYLPHGIGGRGIAAEIAWNEIPRGVAAFSAKAPLIMMTGPLTGTMAPFSGRTTVCGLAPQGYPHEWYTRSSFGGHFGPELKYAGFDGLVIIGQAAHPVYLKIDNQSVSIEDARCGWGMGLIEFQKSFRNSLGSEWKVFAIGPAGENLVRVAVAATETESASGQGGFGAVMGSKNLKAIAVRGSGLLPIAEPEYFQKICTLIREEAHASHGWPHTPRLDPLLVKKYGQRFQACTQGCAIRCFDARFYTRVPSTMCPGKILSGQIDCVAGLFPGVENTFYNWRLGFEAGFEIAQLTNEEGLNHWELIIGTVPWLRYLTQDSSLNHINGTRIDFDDINFWHTLVLSISRRRGATGKALAEGTVRGSKMLGMGEYYLDRLFPAWGYAGHWDGRGDHGNIIYFPFWIVSALQWAVDTRDPISSGHGYVQNIMNWSRENSPVHGLEWEHIMRVGEHIYGSRDSVDPHSSYQAKAYPAFWHGRRSVMKDSLTVDDQVFPRIFSRHTADHIARAGDLEGQHFEYEMLKAATGFTLSETELDFWCDRTINLERLLLHRNFNRCRQDDETVIPYFEAPENWPNPLYNKAMHLDRRKFKDTLSEFYQLRGWDEKTGNPTPETIDRFKLPQTGHR